MIRCIFEKYKTIFGQQNKGIHKYRLAGTAIIDYILTIISCIIVTYITNIPLVITTIVILILGIILHMLFGVETSSIKYLGLSC